jgi:hypothetical protein
MRTYVRDRRASRPSPLSTSDRAPRAVARRGCGAGASEPPARGCAPARPPLRRARVTEVREGGAAVARPLPRRALADAAPVRLGRAGSRGTAGLTRRRTHTPITSAPTRTVRRTSRRSCAPCGTREPHRAGRTRRSPSAPRRRQDRRRGPRSSRGPPRPHIRIGRTAWSGREPTSRSRTSEPDAASCGSGSHQTRSPQGTFPHTGARGGALAPRIGLQGRGHRLS